MTSEAALDRAVSGTIRGYTPIIRHAGRVLCAAGGLGVVGQLLFFGVGLGVNFPIAISLLLVGGWLLRRQRRPAILDVWLGPAAILFAAFAAVRADPVIVSLDLLTSMALTGGALASFGGRPVVARSFMALIELAFTLLVWATGGALRGLIDARHALPDDLSVTRRVAPIVPILRGLLVAIPVVLVFVALFSSADAVFARLVENLFGIRLEFGDAAWRIAFAALLSWLAAGGLALAASVPATSPAPAGRPAARWRFGTIETLTVLIAVDAVFLVFVALQGTYLFGGLETIESGGMTYADYARRGFFELVAVAVLAGGLIIAADRLARDRSRRLVAAAVGLASLTGVVLVSAAIRLRLYQEAYGWTELRLYVLATIVLLAIGVIGLVVVLVADRVRWMGHVLVMAALVIGLGLNIIGPARLITEQNVARVLDEELVPTSGHNGLDVSYAVTLGDDAVPTLLGALPALDEDEADYLRDELKFRLGQLRADTGLQAWQAWNAGRAAARDALEASSARGELP